MKKLLLIGSVIAISLSALLGLSQTASASDLATKLKGRILLAVESNGEAWYVNPDNQKKYYLGRPNDAFNLMKNLGLGISNKDFDAFKGKAPARLSGKILLKVQDAGKAYYVNPLDLKLHYLGRPFDAFQLMRKFGLGITNMNLSLIATAVSNTKPSIEVANFDNLTLSMIDSTIDGWVVIHKEVNGQPGEIVGHAPIKAGTNLNVIVQLTGISQSQNLIAMIHHDMGKKGTFEYPGADTPLMFEGKTVMKKFFYTYTVSID